jgi:hypothetical protein
MYYVEVTVTGRDGLPAVGYWTTRQTVKVIRDIGPGFGPDGPPPEMLYRDRVEGDLTAMEAVVDHLRSLGRTATVRPV